MPSALREMKKTKQIFVAFSIKPKDNKDGVGLRRQRICWVEKGKEIEQATKIIKKDYPTAHGFIYVDF